MTERAVSCRRLVSLTLIVLVALVLLLAGILFGWRAVQTAPTPTPTLPPPPPTEETQQEEGASHILYQTDFTSLESWELFDDGIVSAQIVDGQLIVGVQAMQDTGAWSGLNYTFGDFVLEVDATKLAGSDDNSIIVVFRLVNNDNYYRFDISSDGFYALSKVQNGARQIISDYAASPAILQGEATNHIRIEARGDTFRFSVNDTPLLLCVPTSPDTQPLWDHAASEPTCLGGQLTEGWTDPDFPQGKVGLGTQGFAGFDTMAEATIGFDNLVIRQP